MLYGAIYIDENIKWPNVKFIRNFQKKRNEGM